MIYFNTGKILQTLILPVMMMFSIIIQGQTGVLRKEFEKPPVSAQPGVYWYFQNGNLDKKEMINDLDAMKESGIGNLIFLEIALGAKQGPVDFMSKTWKEYFTHSVRHAEDIGIDISLGIGPGWSGSGGPWVPAEESMQHLCYSTVQVEGPIHFNEKLPLPKQQLSKFNNMESDYYEDVITFAVPDVASVIPDINERALYYRMPYTISKNRVSFIEMPAKYTTDQDHLVIDSKKIIELTGELDLDGTLNYKFPAGKWIIIRMASRPTGASTRPAPKPGEGFEHDKLSKKALENHFNNYYGKLMKTVGERKGKHGWTTVHLDSWEMGAQNWTVGIREDFKKRFGYDSKRYLPTFTGRIVNSREQSERFLWDWRMLCNEKIIHNYAGHLSKLAHKNGFNYSNEPYAMTPVVDLDLGAVADIPMCEFWSQGGHNSVYSCIEATSIAHTMGREIVGAESFTAARPDWKLYPGAIKNQNDWAFCMGINRIVFHTFPHKPLGDEFQPGLTMGRYGVHWDRKRIWWPLVNDYHEYISRCSHLLRQGTTVSDILYLTPEGAPHVFVPPTDALHDKSVIQDKKGYGFDGCTSNILKRASVVNNRVSFPEASSYRIVVLPNVETMTPAFLKQINELLESGATIIGNPPISSPSLENYPSCDEEVKALALKLWGSFELPNKLTKRKIGKGTLFWGTELKESEALYPSYKLTASLLSTLGLPEDFKSSANTIRFTHRETLEDDIYFVSNRKDKETKTDGFFRISKGTPTLWDPVTGKTYQISKYTQTAEGTTIPLHFYSYQSYFVVFSKKGEPQITAHEYARNTTEVKAIEGSWEVAFETKRGGPEKASFEELIDWTKHKDESIKYYSGLATYSKTFEMKKTKGQVFLELGTVHDMARVTLNGKDLGVVWCAPWRIAISEALKNGKNELKIEVANRWVNRLKGDMLDENKNVRILQSDKGLLGGEKFLAGRYTYTTLKFTPEKLKILPAGLLGPVKISIENNN